MNELKACEMCGREILWMDLKPGERVAVEPMPLTYFTQATSWNGIPINGCEHRLYRNHLDVCPKRGDLGQFSVTMGDETEEGP